MNSVGWAGLLLKTLPTAKSQRFWIGTSAQWDRASFVEGFEDKAFQGCVCMTIWLCFGFRVAAILPLENGWRVLFFRGFEESKIQLSHRCTSPVFGGKFAAQSSKRVQGLISGITQTSEHYIIYSRYIMIYPILDPYVRNYPILHSCVLYLGGSPLHCFHFLRLPALLMSFEWISFWLWNLLGSQSQVAVLSLQSIIDPCESIVGFEIAIYLFMAWNDGEQSSGGVFREWPRSFSWEIGLPYRICIIWKKTAMCCQDTSRTKMSWVGWTLFI